MENHLEVISKRLGIIEELLLDLKHAPALPPSTSFEELLTVEQAARLLKLTPPTIYGLVYERKIPYSKRGKRLYFSQQELLDWVKSGRQKTAGELEEQARQIVTIRQNRRIISKDNKDQGRSRKSLS
ncbi:helix-turn-helix domain-containing protein [Larkinella bovis]|uniref:Helix-turn-helix domain-containing protein n=1 Tax=Larkinella bovis TaxID=683041 RepID=A0ABW0I8Y7_9BACT